MDLAQAANLEEALVLLMDRTRSVYIVLYPFWNGNNQVTKVIWRPDCIYQTTILKYFRDREVTLTNGFNSLITSASMGQIMDELVSTGPF